MRCRHLILLVLFAVFSFGGSFTCVWHSGGDDHDHDGDGQVDHRDGVTVPAGGNAPD